MAGIARKTASIFANAQAGSPSNEIAVFGAKAQGYGTQFSADPEVIQSAAWLQGWVAAVVAQAGGTTQPELEDDQAFKYVMSYQAAYLLERGMPEWDDDTTYNQFDYVKDPATGIPWYSLSDGNLNNPPASSPGVWATLFSLISGGQSGAPVAKAWVVFNGQGPVGTITPLQSFGVASLTKNGTGDYTLTPSAPFANANPGLAGAATGGIQVIVAAGTGSIRFQTQGIVGGPFQPFDYPYVSTWVFSL